MLAKKIVKGVKLCKGRTSSLRRTKPRLYKSACKSRNDVYWPHRLRWLETLEAITRYAPGDNGDLLLPCVRKLLD